MKNTGRIRLELRSIISNLTSIHGRAEDFDKETLIGYIENERQKLEQLKHIISKTE